MLKRAIRTLWIALEELDLMWIPVHNSWRLNERHYGALQGLNKAEMATRYGDEQILVWRRSYDVPPPALDPGRRALARDAIARYAELAPAASCRHRVPEGHGCALSAVLERARSRPAIAAGKRVLIAAHGNSMRALIKYLDDVSDQDIVGLNIPTGVPLVYELDAQLQAAAPLLPRRPGRRSRPRSRRSQRRARRSRLI